MSAIGTKHSKCAVKGCKGRRPYWSRFCKFHRENRPIETRPLEEIRTLPSGATFVRFRCLNCQAYWDTGHHFHADEKENHHAGCKNL